MNNVIAALAVGAVLGLAMWSCLSVPIVQKSYSTKQVVACASEDTNWEMVSVLDRPECNDITQAEVEWVR